MPSFIQKSVLAALAGAASVAAHGHVTQVEVGGTTFTGFNPFQGNNPQPDSVGWSTTASDNGFVLPDGFSTRDIICHKGSKNAPKSVTIAAGSTMTISWDTWPDSHKGPVLDYLAPCGSAGCATVDAESLEFFKIDEAGLENGVWASDKLMADGMKWDVTIPASLAPGEYVLRHEMLGLHEGDRANGAQFYPQCINLEVTGSGSESPAGVKATEFYKADDAGVLFNLYNNPTSYPIPGPAVFSSGSGSGSGNGGNSGSSPAPPTSTKAPATTPTPTQGSGNGGNNGGAAPTTTATPTPSPDCLTRRAARRAARKARRDALARLA